MIKSSSSACAAVLLFALAAAAQDTPKAEVFLGYTYNRVNSALENPSFSANGGGGQFVYNFGKWIGFVTDLGAVHNGNIGGHHLDSTMTNFLFGPRVPIRVSDRFTPYFHSLFGGVYASSSVKIDIPPDTPIAVPPMLLPNPGAGANLVSAVALRASAQQTAFAMAFGGGLDIKINRHASFRPIGLDYYMMRLQNIRTATDNNQHGIRYTTGINFTFGAR